MPRLLLALPIPNNPFIVNTPGGRILCRVMARLLVLIAAVGLLALPAAPLAATRSNGTLSVKRAKGHIQIKLRGTVIGSMASGSVRIRDLTPNDGQYATFRHCHETIVSLTTSVCKGKKLSFRALDGAYIITTNGSGTFLSAVGRGTVTLDGAGNGTSPTGVMSLDGGPYQPIPIDPTTYQLGNTTPRP